MKEKVEFYTSEEAAKVLRLRPYIVTVKRLCRETKVPAFKFGGGEDCRDRIEIYNPGQFPFDHDPDEFIAGYGKSYPRNPLIAEAFYLAKDIERRGSCLLLIKEECDASGVKIVFKKYSLPGI